MIEGGGSFDYICKNKKKWGIFVKPVRDKAFTGHVINSPADLVGCGNCHENYEVLCCDVIDFKREWGGFIIYDELVDIRPYKGDYHYHFDPDVVDQVIEAFKTIPNNLTSEDTDKEEKQF